ncbi:glycine--tRNA ligase subunit beta [Campylobacter gracilis]|uniref:Glycine--tRNA ligase beta subunit n=1 Tax=Campylobacter gracilis RM3268 TaxID=553220 RepID=C8PE27_9BACT|nr:glycine--tRNA ligase subunit beta [Campylobacter gracilis]AKT92774.1 glycyl-tRNA synthetase, beta chain [Campylobacter gracilis]EEV18900.1 glycine--tRNA ligase, beta subunit [Campylobacter gracilis RM3268]UEB45052.1 glycine--tRNA ligase subunit beta [Campylobacter gracilis]SUW82290.1 glycyl-tRNA synthetase subunit beta [Campylobacter gracilis]
MELLIEIGVEELPAIPFLKERANIAPKWRAVLEANRINSDFRFEFSPRRFVLFHEDFPQRGDDAQIVSTGAPKSVALKDGAWSPAALSFAKKYGISESELEFRQVGGKEVLYHAEVQKGRDSREILGEMIEEFLRSLNFGRAMRWGSGEFEFIRPIRSIACVLGGQNVDFEIYGVRSAAAFFPHRKFGYEAIKFKDAVDYFALLERNGVILSEQKRKDKILSEFAKLEKKHGFKIEVDPALLDEVTAITEYPTALLGSFERDFLSVPKEVIITSMKENQRYFPVFEGKNLSNHFVVVSNAITDDDELVVRGNEKVLRARLSDAMFFWKSDLQAEFSPEKLKQISYMQALGSVYDKQVRELAVARALSADYATQIEAEIGKKDFAQDVENAVMFSKADLSSTMVGEFSELQGIMGSYYAAHAGLADHVCRAIREQYLPSGEDSELPSGVFSSVIAIAMKFETLLGLFSINKVPSGNKDPYALRRAATGLIKILLNQGLSFDANALAQKLAPNYKKFDISKLLDFIKDRLYGIFDEINPSVIKACIASGENDLLLLSKAIKALGEIAAAADFGENFATFKRLANIIKDEKIGAVDENLFEHGAERALNAAFRAIKLNENDVSGYLRSLFGLKGVIDDFFDNVMINVQDVKIRTNRIANIGQIYRAFLQFADIKEIGF